MDNKQRILDLEKENNLMRQECEQSERLRLRRISEATVKKLVNSLEKKIEERTKELVDTQAHLIQSEKMAALGHLIAGIAHEINTPLGAINSSISSISDALEEVLVQLPELLIILSNDEQKIFFTMIYQSSLNSINMSIKEKRSAKKYIHTLLDKYKVENAYIMADLFVNLGIYENIQPYITLIEHPKSKFIFNVGNKLSSVRRAVKNITLAVERSSKVIFALKNYAHYDHSGEKNLTNLKDGIETVLTIYHSQIKQGVELIRKFQEIPPILCYPDELNQVWTNLVHNALQAMSYKGIITVEISQQEGYAIISISDTGKGISKENIAKIFNPFFTTKPAGEGSGLGLDIVKKIIDKHDGEIIVNSEVNKGTTFIVKLKLD